MKNILAIILLLTSVNTFAQNKKWTLQQCVNHALESNIIIKQTENTLLSNDQDIKAAKGSFLPTVSGNTGYTLSIGNRELFPGQFVDRTDNSAFVSVGASQTIFNGFRNLNTKKQAILTKETNELDLARIKDDVSLNVVNAYLNVLFNKENLETAEAQYEFSATQLKQVGELVDAGVQPKASLYDAEATLASDKQSVTTAQNNYDLALLSLAQLLLVPVDGFEVETIDVTVPGSLFYDDVNPILSFAYENRNELKVAEKNIELAELNTEIAKSGFFPTVTGGYTFGSNVFYSNVTQDEANFIDQLNNQKSHRFNVNINIPIFSGFANRTSVDRSKIQEDTAKLSLEQEKQNLEANIQRAFADAKAAFNSYEASQESLKAQELAFTNSQERYSIGALNTFDLEQARVRLVNAQNVLTNAKYDFVFKTKVLDFYAGKSLIE
ncbi:MAG: TolC family protein [Flavobacteriaceae bacterium]|nr:TolC family protein [Flavobacteriaceae bacterium]